MQTRAPPAQKELPFDVTIRAFDKDDSDFVLSSWLKANRERNSSVDNETYYKHHQILIGTLARHARIAVACDAKEPRVILGWACAEPRGSDGMFIVHFVYVKKTYRRYDIARKLVNALQYRSGEPVYCTHWSWYMPFIRERFNLIYNPYLLCIGNKLSRIYK